MLRIRTGSPAPPDQAEANDQVPSSSINGALDDLDKMKNAEMQSELQSAKKQMEVIGQKAAKNLDALDRLIDKTETAQMSLDSQNQQMKKHLRK